MLLVSNLPVVDCQKKEKMEKNAKKRNKVLSLYWTDTSESGSTKSLGTFFLRKRVKNDRERVSEDRMKGKHKR